MGLWSRIRKTVGGNRHRTEIDEELQFHLDMERADGYYALGKAHSFLDEGRYTYAMPLLEGTLKRYQGPEIRLALSYAYLARRDASRAERPPQGVG